MAHAGVILGLAVDGVLVEDVATTAKTFPDFAGAWSRAVHGSARVTTGRYSEHDHEHYERPRRRTRPRTKDRPSYDDAVAGARGDRRPRPLHPAASTGSRVMAMKSRPLGRKGVVVGDHVRVVGDTSGVDGSLARIVEVVPRTTTLRRTADDDDPVERVIVSNADQLVVVTALADPEPRPRLIDRALVAAYDAGMAPLLCLTKADLADPEVLLSTYRSLGVPWVVTQLKGEGAGDLTELLDRLRGRTSVLVGPQRRRQVDPRQRAHPRRPPRGRHRQRRHRSRPPHLDQRLPARAARRRRLDHRHPGHPLLRARAREPENLIEAFPDLDEMTEDCPRGCTHGTGEPECGLDEAVAAGEADPDRVESFRRLLAARERDATGSRATPRRRGRRSRRRGTGTTSRATAPTASSTIDRDAEAGLPRAPARRQRRDAAERPGGEQRDERVAERHVAQQLAALLVLLDDRRELGARLEQRLAGLGGQDRRRRGDHGEHDQGPAQQPAPPRDEGVRQSGEGRQRAEDDHRVDDERVQRHTVEFHACRVGPRCWE